MRRLLAMRWWLALAFAGVAAFTAVGVVAVADRRAERALRDYSEEIVIGNAVAAAESLKSDDTVAQLRADTAALARQRRLALYVFDAQGRPLTPTTSLGLSWDEVLRGRMAMRSALGGVRYIHGHSDGSAYVVALTLRRGAGAALVAYSVRPELGIALGIVQNQTGKAALVAGAAGALLGLLVATLIARRLGRIADAAQAIGAGDFGVAVRSGFPDEVGSLAHSIERMRGQLEALFHQLESKERAQREFAANAAHELRTPLAAIVTAVELLQTGAKDEPEARDEFLAMIAEEAERLTRLTRALLVLARAEAQEEPPRCEAVALAPLLRQVATGRAAGARVDCPPELVARADPDLLEQALSSLVANAVQHAPDGALTLRARGAGDRVVVEVVDTGGGIPPAERSRVFERFYQGGDRNGGFGLGLAIARQSVRNLGGEIELESETGVGTTVRLILQGIGG